MSLLSSTHDGYGCGAIKLSLTASYVNPILAKFLFGLFAYVSTH